ncbi:PH domain-containing protein [Patescibacteria group bacterium]|nr:PH domain-containing protein [Patescibacteria group bacterium]
MDEIIVKKVTLKAGEEIVAVVRNFGLTLWPKILVAAFLIIAPFFFLFPLFGRGYWGVALFFLPILLGVIFTIRTFVLWYYNAFIITNRRVVDIDQRGFFERVVSEADFSEIKDISHRRKGIWQTIFRYGNVRIQISDTDIGLEIRNVRAPEDIQQLISDLLHPARRKPDGTPDLSIAPPDNEEFKIIKENVADLSEKQLEELDSLIRNRIRQIKLKRLEEIKNIGRDEGCST